MKRTNEKPDLHAIADERLQFGWLEWYFPTCCLELVLFVHNVHNVPNVTKCDLMISADSSQLYLCKNNINNEHV